jgi:hypothetical protein
MRDEQLLFFIAVGCVIFIGSVAIYLARRVATLEEENRKLRTPF